MSRDEVAKRLRKVFNEHAKDIDPSSQALFTINRRINEAELPEYSGRFSGFSRRIWRPVTTHFRPVYAFAAALLLLVGGLSGFLLTSNTVPSTQVEVASPELQDQPAENSNSNSDVVDASGNDSVTANSNSVPVNPTTCLSDGDSDEIGSINIYFICNGELLARHRSAKDASLKDAVKLLAAGPTQSEIQNGFTSSMVDLDGTLVKSVQVENGRAVIDFSSALPKSTNGLSQLNATVFNFPDINLVEYRVEGSCDSFIRQVSRGSCQTFLRTGSRSGSSDRYVVLINQSLVGQRIIRSCPSASNCRSLGDMEYDSVYHFTGEKSESDAGEWLELLTPDGRIGWVLGEGVSVQQGTPANTAELVRLVESLNAIPEDQYDLFRLAFSSDGVYGSYFSSAPYGYFYLADPSDVSSRLNLGRILNNLEGAKVADKIDSTPILENLEHLTLETDIYHVNVYFDFRNGYPEIIGLSFHNKIVA